MKRTDIAFTTFETPYGTAGLAARNGKLIRVRNRIDSIEEFKDFLESHYGQLPIKQPKIFDSLIFQFNLYFKGLLKNFIWPLDFSFGTIFQQKVWQSLLLIPYGETRSYRCLAELVGNQKASRAVGSANRRNPLPVIIPCHRIIRNNGQLGGYDSGTDIKFFLIELERNSGGPL